VIPDDVIAEVLGRTDIVALIGSYLPLKSAGRTHKALCPFHTEKTPSFTVNPERQIFHCFGCGEGGDAIGFLIKHERLSFLEAVRVLAERAGVTLPAQRGGGPAEADSRVPLYEVHRLALQHFRESLAGPLGQGAQAYLATRGVSAELVERFALGYALPGWDGLLKVLRTRGYPDRVLETAGLVIPRPKGTGHYDRFRNRLMIPIWDVSGKVIGFGGRALDGSEVKYLNSPETPLYRKGAHLYGLNLAAKAIREQKTAIVVEGYFDALMLHAHGFEHTVAALGTALTTDQARLLARYAETVVLLFDPDAAGIGAARRSLEHLINVDLDWRIVVLPEALDPDAFLRQHGREAFVAALAGAQDLVDFFLDRRVSGLNLGDPVQLAKGVDALIEVVGQIESPIRREGYLTRIAQRSGIAPRTLLEAIGRRRHQVARPGAEPPAAARPAAPPTAEEHLLTVALHHPDLGRRVAAALAPEDIQDPVLRQIFSAYVIAGQAPGPMSRLPDLVQQRLSALLASPGEAEDEVALARIVDDCLARIRQRRTKGERSALFQALLDAERQGKQADALRLLADHPSVKGPKPT
jgi:DNA primase